MSKQHDNNEDESASEEIEIEGATWRELIASLELFQVFLKCLHRVDPVSNLNNILHSHEEPAQTECSLKFVPTEGSMLCEGQVAPKIITSDFSAPKTNPHAHFDVVIERFSKFLKMARIETSSNLISGGSSLINSPIRASILRNCDKLSKQERQMCPQLGASQILHYVETRVTKMHKNKRIKQNWNKEDIRVLLWILSKYMDLRGLEHPEQLRENLEWTEISCLIPGTNAEKCMFRWLDLKKVNLATVSWSPVESNLLAELVESNQFCRIKPDEAVDYDWKKIAEELYRRCKTSSHSPSIHSTVGLNSCSSVNSFPSWSSFNSFVSCEQTNSSHFKNSMLRDNLQVRSERHFRSEASLIDPSEAGQIFRNAKQCRQHWACYLNPGLKKGLWTNEESLKLLRLVKWYNYEKHWSYLAQFFNGRTQNAVKNRYELLIVKLRKVYRTKNESVLIENFLSDHQSHEMAESIKVLENNDKKPLFHRNCLRVLNSFNHLSQSKDDFEDQFTSKNTSNNTRITYGRRNQRSRKSIEPLEEQPSTTQTLGVRPLRIVKMDVQLLCKSFKVEDILQNFKPGRLKEQGIFEKDSALGQSFQQAMNGNTPKYQLREELDVRQAIQSSQGEVNIVTANGIMSQEDELFRLSSQME